MSSLLSHLRELALSPKSDWVRQPLGSLGRVVSGGTPATSNPAYWGGGVPWVTPAEISGLHTRYIAATERSISKAGLQASSAELLPSHSLIVCTRASVGEMVINTVPMATNQGFKSIIPTEGVSVEFLYYSLRANVAQLHRLAAGSTFSEVSKTAFEGLILSVPPMTQQEKIAGLLGSMDDEVSLLAALTTRHRHRQLWLASRLLASNSLQNVSGAEETE